MRAHWSVWVGILVLVAALPAFAGKGGDKGKPGGEPPPSDPRILFTSEGAIHLANDDGSNLTTVLTDGDEYLLHADWSPDGTQIVFESRLAGDGVYVMDADGGNVRLVTPMTNFDWAHPVWSPVPAPDGQAKIAFVDKVGTDFRAICCVNLDGTGRQQLTFPSAGTSGHWNVVWSPDATQIAVVADTDGSSVPDDVLVCDLQAATGGGLEVASVLNLMSEADNPDGTLNAADYLAENIAWAKQGTRLAVSARLPGGSDTIYVIDVASPKSPTMLTAGRNPSWSSDDTRLVFERFGGARGTRDVWVVDADGANEALLIEGSKRLSPHTPVWRR